MKHANTKVRSSDDVATYLLGLPRQPAWLDIRDPRLLDIAIKESAHGLALSCRTAVDLALERLNVQTRRQDYLKFAGKALNIVAGTLSYAGGADMLAESGIAKFADWIFSTVAINTPLLGNHINDLLLSASNEIKNTVPISRFVEAQNVALQFVVLFREAWHDLYDHSNALRHVAKKPLNVPV